MSGISQPFPTAAVTALGQAPSGAISKHPMERRAFPLSRGMAAASTPTQLAPFARMCVTGYEDLLDTITTTSGVSPLAGVCKTFRSSVQRVLPQQWAEFPLERYPHIQHLSGTLGLPQNVADVQRYFDTARAMSLSFGNTSYVRRTTDFSPAIVVPSLENALRRAENDYNLLKIAPRIRWALRIMGVVVAEPTTADQARLLLTSHHDTLANLQQLDLSDLGLTAIPEEFSALPLTNLHILNLGFNRLTSLAGFPATVPQLQWLNLLHNQLTSLAGFPAAIPQLQYLNLDLNQLASLAHFPVAVPQLQTLNLLQNRLTSLPNNFLASATQLQTLNLSCNQLASLPTGFGNAWPWWAAHRNAILAGNPILMS